MPTPISGAAAYCTISQFLDRYDARLVGDLLGDAGQRLSATDLAASTRLTELLQDASGMVESACLLGGKYKHADLEALNGNSQRFLRRIVADLTIGMVRGRRGYSEEEPMPQYKAALETLERLRLGERIFALQENAEAGNPTSEFLRESDIERTDLATFQARRFFGLRAQRSRLGS